MKLIGAALTFMVLAVLLVAPAHAQATRTWVSGVGSDSTARAVIDSTATASSSAEFHERAPG